jgi:hypothetical protein
MLDKKKLIKDTIDELIEKRPGETQKVIGLSAEIHVLQLLRNAGIKYKEYPPNDPVDVSFSGVRYQTKTLCLASRVADENIVRLVIERGKPGGTPPPEGRSYKISDVDAFIIVNALFPDLPNMFRIPGKVILKEYKKYLRKNKHNKRIKKPTTGCYPQKLPISKKILLKYVWNP